MSPMKLTRAEAQALAVIASGLDRRPTRRRVTRDDILDVFHRLGTIQLDTISVISRSHETVLWSRLGAYDPSLIVDLYERDHSLTEYMAHAASILPADLLYLFRPYMERVRRSESAWLAEPENREVAEAIIQRITAEGPMTSRHFESPPDAERTEAWHWWGNKPERRVLSHLWMHGELMIHKRDRGFARHFDLPERVVPGFWDGEAIPGEEAQRELAMRAISALGVTTAAWVTDYFRTGGQSHIPNVDARRILAEFAVDRRAIPIEVEGIDTPMWMDPARLETLELLRQRKGWPTHTTLLSPFDNLIWRRDRTELLWGFSYVLEIYVPAPKRRYGYYSLSILHKGRLVGRLDPSFDRRKGILTIKALHLEPGVRVSDSLVRAITRTVEDLLAFLGGQPGAWVLGTTDPPELASMLRPYAGEVLRAAD